MPSVEFAEEARADIRSIIAYTIDHWGTPQARKYVNGLQGFCAQLAAMPNIGKDVTWLMPGLRAYPFRSHIIYYREKTDGIFVVAIVHKRQDPERRLGP